MMRTLAFFCICFFTTTLSAQKANNKNNQLKFKINGVKDTIVHLANYYGNKLYYADTARADKNGNIVFNKKQHPGGVYAVVVPGNKYFEIIIDKEDIEIESDTTDLPGKIIIKKSENNKLFYEYIRFINQKRNEAEPIRAKLKEAENDPERAASLREQLQKIDKEVKTYQQQLIKNNPDKLVAKIIKISMDVEIPEAPKNADGSPVDSLFAYKYNKAHYFDNIDLTDDRLVRSPFFHNRIENYYKNMIAQIPDTFIVEIDRTVPLFESSKEQFKYVVHHLTYNTETSKVMCMDAAFVHIVNKYYKTGKVWWLEPDKLKKITDRATELEPILCGVKVHPLSMLDSTNTRWIRLYDIKAEYIALIFWDPDCGHCKKEMPKFAGLYNKFKGKGFEVYAVSSDHDEKWRKYIRENNLNWINVGIPADYYSKQEKAIEQIQKGNTDLKSLNYRTTFDIYSTPKVFLLDKNKKIIAKQIEAEQMEKLLEFYYNKEEKKTEK
jgi:peroxiredoxin